MNADAEIAGSPQPRRNNTGRLLLGFLALLLLAYLASPYLSFWRLTKALQSADHRKLDGYVDFQSVRQSLKEQLRAKLPKPPAPGSSGAAKQDVFTSLVQRLGPSLIDQLVDAFVTPEGLAALIADPEVAKKASSSNPGAVAEVAVASAKEKKLDWSQVKYAFFTGPKDFLVDVDGTKLRFRFTQLRWKLKAVELSLDELKL